MLRKFAPAETQSLVATVINDAIQNTSAKVTAEVVQGVVNKSYWHLTPNEIRTCFRDGLSGLYGFVPSGANPLLYWLMKYDQERDKKFESENMRFKEPYEKQLDEFDRQDKQEELKKLTNEITRQENYQKAKEIVKQKTDKSHHAKEVKKIVNHE